MTYINVDKADNGKEIILSMNSTLRVVLEENPSTGYMWEVEDNNSSCLQMISSNYFAKNNMIMGAGGIVAFNFKSLKPGRCPLSLKLWRSWEGEDSIVKRFKVIVTVTTR